MFEKYGLSGLVWKQTMWCQEVFSLVFRLFIVQLLIAGASLEEPEVQLSTGRVQGQRLVSAANRSYYSFQGIPYAKPPVGYLRFKAPQPPEAWNDTLKAFDIPPACSQPWRKLEYPETIDEDCLYINVFTPYLTPPEDVPMPVMVWIHGGQHYESSSTRYKYGADFLITDGVILVTFNYRLGVFGYLNINTKSAQGNAAEKDKVAALRWVQKEIKNFGGDPNLVTIFGGSSGALDVYNIYFSPLSTGLFHRAVSQSAPNMGEPSSSRPHPVNPGVTLAQQLGCGGDDVEETVACLRGVSASVLADAQMRVVTAKDGSEANPFSTTIEEDHGEEVFLSEPAEELAKRSTSSVPYMMGMNTVEGRFNLGLPEDKPTLFTDFFDNFESYLPSYIRENSSPRVLRSIVMTLKQYYFNNQPPSYDNVYPYINFFTDLQYTYFLNENAKMFSSRAPVYLYFFTFDGEFEIPFKTDILNISGPGHGQELGYLFYRNIVIPEQNHMEQYPRECITLTRMVRLWTNFAKYGNPTPRKDGLLGETWLPATEAVARHLVINDSLQMEPHDLLPERYAVWQAVNQLAAQGLDDGYSLGLMILLTVVALAAASLAYLLYTSKCRSDGYSSL